MITNKEVEVITTLRSLLSRVMGEEVPFVFVYLTAEDSVDILSNMSDPGALRMLGEGMKSVRNPDSSAKQVPS
jgi:hypothetical protein